MWREQHHACEEVDFVTVRLGEWEDEVGIGVMVHSKGLTAPVISVFRLNLFAELCAKA